ncbi:MAG: TenA family protein [Pseudomonadota bacterium]
MFFTCVRQRAQLLINEMLKLPFIQALATGELEEKKFVYYLQQDKLFLQTFARVLALLAGRVQDMQIANLLLRNAQTTITEENKLSQNLLQHYQVTADKITVNPSCFNYGNFLLKQAVCAPTAEAMATVLPCFWVYQQVAKRLKTQVDKNNPYRAWIELYASHDYAHTVEMIINCTNALAKDKPYVTVNAMEHAFFTAIKLEWYFWRAAYVIEKWLI